MRAWAAVAVQAGSKALEAEEEVADQVCAGNARAGLGEHRLPLPAIKVNHL